VALGYAEFALSGPTQHAWDHAAGVLAVERAGGVAAFLDGAPYDPGRSRGPLLVAASQSVWDDVAGRVAGLV
jgi:fructose-1,6-bisphosphatase/inositol monophosphatase family enzyme